mgnify:CR=1 FL=1
MTSLGAHPGTGHSARRPEGRPDLHCHSGLSVRPRCHSGLNAPCPHVHRRVAVQTILPLALERTDRTATRPRAYRFGTLDAIWQCKLHCHSTPSVRPRVGGTATRARAYRSHCHSGPNVPPPHVHRRVAVQTILPLTLERTDRTATRPRAYRFGTFDAIWQCKLHCHSTPSVRPRVGGTATRA